MQVYLEPGSLYAVPIPILTSSDPVHSVRQFDNVKKEDYIQIVECYSKE